MQRGAHAGVDDEQEADATGAALPVGTVVAEKYEIKRVLGSGGNGAVYEAEHRLIGHRVAIKVVHKALTEREEILRRFSYEARICGSLRHPNVGQVYDVGVLGDGAPYMVMELQDGRSLSDVLDETTLPVAAVVDIVRQLLSGLAAVHQAGAVHRDVKPDNVMIVRDRSGEAVVKLVDFGIAKTLGRKRSDRRTTGEGLIVGSPDYMPPEQLRGGAVDGRTDLYAAGVVAYEALTGRTPFDGETVTDLAIAVISDPVTPPTELRKDCPPELEAVVLKALSRDPADRYQTADEMSRALAEVRASHTPESSLARISERPLSPPGDARVRRRRTIDLSTLEWVQEQVGGGRRRTHRRLLIATGAGLVVLAVALASFRGNEATEAVRVDVVDPSEPVVPPPPPAAPAPVPAPAAEPAGAPRAAVDEPPPGASSAVTAPTVAAAPPALVPPAVAAPPAPPPPAPPAIVPLAASKSAAARSAPAPSPRAPAPATPSLATSGPNAKELLEQAATAFALGDAAGARDLYRRIVRIAPRDAGAWRGLGVVASSLGDDAEARRAFERYLALRPDAPDAERVRARLTALR